MNGCDASQNQFTFVRLFLENFHFQYAAQSHPSDAFFLVRHCLVFVSLCSVWHEARTFGFDFYKEIKCAQISCCAYFFALIRYTFHCIHVWPLFVVNCLALYATENVEFPIYNL